MYLIRENFWDRRQKFYFSLLITGTRALFQTKTNKQKNTIRLLNKTVTVRLKSEFSGKWINKQNKIK